MERISIMSFISRIFKNESKQENTREIGIEPMEDELLQEEEEQDGGEKYLADGSEAEDEEECYEILEREIHPSKIKCPDCGGITLEGLDFCDKCGGELNQ